MMGRTAKSGAVHPTVRIPSSASLRVTIRAAPSPVAWPAIMRLSLPNHPSSTSTAPSNQVKIDL